MKILIKMTGSIAAFKVCGLISRLTQGGHQVQVVASEAALKFVGEATLEGLSQRPVATNLWTPGRAMDHIQLMRWADLILTAPASANFINSAAAGLGHDLVSTLFLAHDFTKPYLIAPAMNVSMFNHPITQQSLRKLTGLGLKVLGTGAGNLACGEIGEGRLLEPEDLHTAIMNTLTPGGPKVLITSGGTQVPIDDVRFISNKSSGHTGSSLANYLSAQGYQVHLLAAKGSESSAAHIPRTEFTSFDDLKNLLHKELSEKNYDHLIHLAAVSDFEVENTSGKIVSGKDHVLKLKPLPKLIAEVKTWSKNPKLQVIGFKLTSGGDLDLVLKKVKLVLDSPSDFVVHNDLSKIDSETNQHQFTIYDSNLRSILTGRNLKDLGKSIEQLLSQTKGGQYDLSP